MNSSELAIMTAIVESGGTLSYKGMSLVRPDYKAALIKLVDTGFVSAYGGNKWEEALFSITAKGKTAFEYDKRNSK